MELEFSKLEFQLGSLLANIKKKKKTHMELEFSKLEFQLGNTLFELESTKLVF